MKNNIEIIFVQLGGPSDKTAHDQIFIFALIWSLGAFLEDHDRHRCD